MVSQYITCKDDKGSLRIIETEDCLGFIENSHKAKYELKKEVGIVAASPILGLIINDNKSVPDPSDDGLDIIA